MESKVFVYQRKPGQSKKWALPKYKEYQCVYVGYLNQNESIESICALGFEHSWADSVIVVENPELVTAYYVNEVFYAEHPEFAKSHMMNNSDYRDTIIYSLCAEDVFNVLKGLKLTKFEQEEIREIVAEVKNNLCIDWYEHVSCIVKDYVENKNEKEGDKLRCIAQKTFR